MDKIIKILVRFYPVFLKGLGGTLWLAAATVLFGTVLGWVAVAAYTWQYLLTEGEKAWVRRKLWILRTKVSRNG